MAARTRNRFYVYRLFDRMETLYVGKGSGRRVLNQRTAFRCDGEILERFNSETDAFKAERKWIATLQPTENRNPGGNGGRVKRCPPRPLEFYKRINTRVYAARLLIRLNTATPGILRPDIAVRIKDVAAQQLAA